MPDNIQTQPAGAAENPTTRYERSDINARGIVYVGVVMIVGAVVVHLVAWWVFEVLYTIDKPRRQSPFPLAAEQRGEPLPEWQPRLEQVERMEGKVEDAGPLYAVARKRLETYGRVPDKEGVVRIPIDQAMRVIVEEKMLPAREDTGKADEVGRRP
jgi:hypothetical protein